MQAPFKFLPDITGEHYSRPFSFLTRESGEPPEPSIYSRAISLFMMDDEFDPISDNELDFLESTPVVMPNGQSGRASGSGGFITKGMLCKYNNGTMLCGGGTFTVCGFIKLRNVFNFNTFFKLGDNGGFRLSDSMGVRISNDQKIRFDWYDREGAVRNMELSTVHLNNDFVFVAFGYDGSDVWMKSTKDGSSWASVSMADVGMGDELLTSIKIRLGMGDSGSETDMSQWFLTREVFDQTELEWWCNDMDGQTKADILERVGTFPTLEHIPFTTHDENFADNARIGTAPHCMRPSPLITYDPSLAAIKGRYVWFTGGDHDGKGADTGIFMGFSDDVGILPTDWVEVWDSNVTGYEQSETPFLVYNPFDLTRPFYLYFHEYNTGGDYPGFTNVQTRRLITSADLVTWTDEGTVMEPFDCVGLDASVWKSQYYGYQKMYLDGDGNWIAFGPYTDSWPANCCSSVSSDGKTWTPWKMFYGGWPHRFATQQWTPPKYNAGPTHDIININGVTHIIGIMNAVPQSSLNVEPYVRHVAAFPIDADYEISGLPKIVTSFLGEYPTDTYLQSLMTYQEDGITHIYHKFKFHKGHTVYATFIHDEVAANNARPVGFRKTIIDDSIQLDWNNALPHQSYRVYRDTGSGYVLLDDVEGLTYTDTPGGNASYVIRSYHDGIESSDSAIITFEDDVDPPAGIRPAISGDALGTTRNNYTGAVGCKLKSDVDITVSSLGVWCNAGDLGSCIVAIHNDATGTLMGQVTVDRSSATVDGWVYVDLTSFNLIADVVYSLGMSVTSSGDFWREGADVYYTSDPVITIINAAYGSSRADSSALGTNQSYGPCNFKFTETL